MAGGGRRDRRGWPDRATADARRSRRRSRWRATSDRRRPRRGGHLRECARTGIVAAGTAWPRCQQADAIQLAKRGRVGGRLAVLGVGDEGQRGRRRATTTEYCSTVAVRAAAVGSRADVRRTTMSGRERRDPADPGAVHPEQDRCVGALRDATSTTRPASRCRAGLEWRAWNVCDGSSQMPGSWPGPTEPADGQRGRHRHRRGRGSGCASTRPLDPDGASAAETGSPSSGNARKASQPRSAEHVSIHRSPHAVLARTRGRVTARARSSSWSDHSRRRAGARSDLSNADSPSPPSPAPPMSRGIRPTRSWARWCCPRRAARAGASSM